MHPLIDAFLRADDLEDQQVLADQLCEQGHPRGEFIAIQLALGAHLLTKHERSLVRRHISEWIGPIEAIDVASARRWRRGFLSEVRLRLRRSAQILAAIPTPWWQTVEVIRTTKVGPFAEPFTRLLLEAELRALTDYEGPLPMAALLGWLDGPPRLLRSCSLPRLPTFPRTADLEQLSATLQSTTGLPLLRHARLRTYARESPDDYAWLWSTALGTQLTELTIAASPLLAGPWWLHLQSEAPTLRWLCIRGPGYEIVFDQEHLRFSLSSPRYYGYLPASLTQEQLTLRVLDSLPDNSLQQITGAPSKLVEAQICRVCKS